MLLRYPWWSVDSSSWAKIGAFGGILVPHKRKGEFVFTEQPYVIKMSDESPDAKLMGKHYSSMSKAEQFVVLEWLELIGIPLGKRVKEEECKEEDKGVMTCHIKRRAACLLFFEAMRKAIPKWPWAYRPVEKVKFFR